MGLLINCVAYRGRCVDRLLGVRFKLMWKRELFLLPPLEKGGRGGFSTVANSGACIFHDAENPSQPPFTKGGAKYHITLNRTPLAVN